MIPIKTLLTTPFLTLPLVLNQVKTERLVNLFDPAYAAQKERLGTDNPDLKRVLLAGNIPLFVFTGEDLLVVLVSLGATKQAKAVD